MNARAAPADDTDKSRLEASQSQECINLSRSRSNMSTPDSNLFQTNSPPNGNIATCSGSTLSVPERAARKRVREKERRTKLKFRLDELTKLVNKADPSLCSQTRDQPPLNRITIISNAVTVMRRLLEENGSLKTSSKQKMKKGEPRRVATDTDAPGTTNNDIEQSPSRRAISTSKKRCSNSDGKNPPNTFMDTPISQRSKRRASMKEPTISPMGSVESQESQESSVAAPSTDNAASLVAASLAVPTPQVDPLFDSFNGHMVGHLQQHQQLLLQRYQAAQLLSTAAVGQTLLGHQSTVTPASLLGRRSALVVNNPSTTAALAARLSSRSVLNPTQANLVKALTGLDDQALEIADVLAKRRMAAAIVISRRAAASAATVAALPLQTARLLSSQPGDQAQMPSTGNDIPSSGGSSLQKQFGS